MGNDAEQRTLADARLAQSLSERGYADAREPYRARLRELRQAQPSLFEAATRHYAEVVVPDLANAASDPVASWADYGRFLGELEGPGRVVAVDPSGSALHGPDAKPAGDMLIFLPEDRKSSALPLLVPAQPTPAQRASYDLLVLRKLSLSD